MAAAMLVLGVALLSDVAPGNSASQTPGVDFLLRDAYRFALDAGSDGSTTPISIGKLTLGPDRVTLTYSISDGDTDSSNNLFAIDASTGEITYTGGSSDAAVSVRGEAESYADFLVKDVYTLTVTASDSTDSTRSDTITVTVKIVNADTDHAVLEKFYVDTEGSIWGVSDGWTTGADLGDWAGITTNGAGRVTGMGLPSNKLASSIPSELGSLTALTTLNLDDNRLRGGLPPELGNLTALTELLLNGNSFIGSLPPELGSLTALTELLLHENSFSGSIPPELGSLTALTTLDFYDNIFTGSIPPELGKLTALTILGLGINSLSGSVPSELGSLTVLAILYLNDNFLTGRLPNSMTKLDSLSKFYWSGNTGGTHGGLCVPTYITDPDFQAWLDSIPSTDGEICPVPSSDAGLSALSLADAEGNTISIGAFASATTAYTASVDNDVEDVTVTATANYAGATFAIAPADADSDTSGHQVELPIGETAITVTVTAEDDSTTKEYAITVTRAAIANANNAPTITEIGDVAKVDSDAGFNVAVAVGDADADDTHTYSAASGTPGVATASPAQASAKTYDTTTLKNNFVTVTPVSIGKATITVTASDGTDATTETFEVTVAPKAPTSLAATAGDTQVDLSWTASASTGLSGTKVYYKLRSAADGTYAESSGVAGTSHRITGLTNNSTYDFRVAAYKTVDSEDILSAYATASSTPMVPSSDAGLSALSLADAEGNTISIGAFASATTAYTASVDNDVEEATVTATANDAGATIAIAPADADSGTAGHQVELPVGETAITVTVTAEDDSTTKEYTITVTRAAIANNAPTITDIGDVAKVDSDAGFNVAVAVGDTDADDTHTYWAASGTPGVATASPARASAKTYDTTTLKNNFVTVTPVSIGKAIITVTASDGTDATTETFEVTVAPKAPTSLAATAGDAQVDLS